MYSFLVKEWIRTKCVSIKRNFRTYLILGVSMILLGFCLEQIDIQVPISFVYIGISLFCCLFIFRDQPIFYIHPPYLYINR